MKRTPALLLCALVASLSFAFAPTYDARLFAEMRWGSIGRSKDSLHVNQYM